MRAFLFVSALFAALAIAAPAPEAEPEIGVMPRACPGGGPHCPDGEHFVWSLMYLFPWELTDESGAVPCGRPMQEVWYSMLSISMLLPGTCSVGRVVKEWEDALYFLGPCVDGPMIFPASRAEPLVYI
ncbi:hypothetical protein BDV96DRAFT_686864 [Lophiotrema nucula]|uniref:Uncharacterized protein n=1 Tax=Lophiotrema nucula TaxID=690887 RepID=A0A6A5Z995_9PLEO|nr:hypothetical protein BDV96DRAFT_686864 [Lophiotrema nucula]